MNHSLRGNDIYRLLLGTMLALFLLIGLSMPVSALNARNCPGGVGICPGDSCPGGVNIGGPGNIQICP